MLAGRRRRGHRDRQARAGKPGAGDLIRLLRASGFEILDPAELYAPEGAKDHVEYGYVSADWARRWPSEEIWHRDLDEEIRDAPDDAHRREQDPAPSCHLPTLT